jgi:hypothetical protein
MSDAPGHTSKAMMVICAIVIFIALMTAMRIERDRKAVRAVGENGERMLIYTSWSDAMGRCRWQASCAPHVR